jgi:hypothetical protein
LFYFSERIPRESVVVLLFDSLDGFYGVGPLRIFVGFFFVWGFGAILSSVFGKGEPGVSSAVESVNALDFGHGLCDFRNFSPDGGKTCHEVGD